MTNSMIEKAARAHFMDGVNPPKNCPMPRWEDQPAAVKEAHRRKVRATLSAIREPNEAMVKAMRHGSMAFDNEALGPDEHRDSDIRLLWDDAIDSILKEGT